MTSPIKAYTEQETKRLYRQCQLKRVVNGVSQFQTTFIPSKFAIKGEVVKIKTQGEWVDGWIVDKVWREVDEAYLNGIRHAVKHHTDVSDI